MTTAIGFEAAGPFSWGWVLTQGETTTSSACKKMEAAPTQQKSIVTNWEIKTVSSKGGILPILSFKLSRQLSA